MVVFLVTSPDGMSSLLAATTQTVVLTLCEGGTFLAGSLVLLR